MGWLMFYLCLSNYTPKNLTWNPKNQGLEDVCLFHMGDSQVPC